MTSRNPPGRPAAILALLRTTRGRYGPEAERTKQRLLDALAAAPPRSAALLARAQQHLLFLCAFPGARSTRGRARRMLAALEERWVRRLPRSDRAALDDSGVAGSVSRHVFAFPVVRWLVRRAPGAAEIDWPCFDDGARLDPLLRELASDVEREAFDSGEFGTREWIELARRRGGHGELPWLIEASCATPALERACGALWEAAEVPILWRLSGSRWAVTRNALPVEQVVVRTSMRRSPADPARHIGEPLASIEPLPPARARRVIDVARAALAARCREVHAITHANPAEVFWCDLGEGAALAVLGVAPRHRLTVEANYGYLLLANGVPIGYGGVTALFRQANTGINVFDAFRGAEAGFLWARILRAFHTLFGVRRFVINGYQFGEGNAEAIASGAYWFYYRAGFRPLDPARRRLAEAEAARLAAGTASRSSRATLKELARGDLVLDLDGFDGRDFIDERLLPRLGARVARLLGEQPERSRERAAHSIAQQLAEQLGVADLHRRPVHEQRAFRMLAPVVALVAGIATWPRDDQQAIADWMRAKAAPREREFALAAYRNERFFRALARELEFPS